MFKFIWESLRGNEKITKKFSRYYAKFDSAAAMLQANINFLNEKDFPGLGMASLSLRFLLEISKYLPEKLLAEAYIWGGWKEGARPCELHKIDSEKIAGSMISGYPKKKYPAIAIGSSNGALTHLWTAMNIPWLPQTYLIPVRRSEVPLDDPVADMEYGKKVALELLNANPELQLHQMYDPSQDRLMSRRIAYFRVKKLFLGDVYRQFIIDSLEEGGVIFIANCTKKMKTTKVSDQHYFQFGGLGGATQHEYLYGSERVEKFLKEQKAKKNKWTPPPVNIESPEAEWGYESTLTEDIKKLAIEKNYRVVEIKFDEVEDASPFVADLYSWWNEHRGIAEKRLFIESFILLEPYWTIKTGSIPFWMKFNMKPSLKSAEKYVDYRAFNEIYLTLFSNGIKSIGFQKIERWAEIFQNAVNKGEFIGVEKKKFPADFAVFKDYYSDFKKKNTARYPMPEPLSIKQLQNFYFKNIKKYNIKWVELYDGRFCD